MKELVKDETVKSNRAMIVVPVDLLNTSNALCCASSPHPSVNTKTTMAMILKSGSMGLKISRGPIKRSGNAINNKIPPILTKLVLNLLDVTNIKFIQVIFV